VGISASIVGVSIAVWPAPRKRSARSLQRVGNALRLGRALVWCAHLVELEERRAKQPGARLEDAAG